jgi:rubredoxin
MAMRKVYCTLCLAMTRWMVMPQKIVCQECGATLYDDFELESPVEIMQRYNGYCPKCNKKLDFDPDDVKIVPI